MLSSASSTSKSLGKTVPMTPMVEQGSHGSFQVNAQNVVQEKAGATANLKDSYDKEDRKKPGVIPELEPNLMYDDTPFMPKMANETLKAQLGNAAWKLFHTILARYPDNPSELEQATLSQYIHLFARVYPCGDCARHFKGLLEKYPPQTSSRKTAALWGCHIHNKVNERLGKDQYDCTTILEDYDCGCGDDEKEEDETLKNENMDHLRQIRVEKEKESPQLGG